MNFRSGETGVIELAKYVSETQLYACMVTVSFACIILQIYCVKTACRCSALSTSAMRLIMYSCLCTHSNFYHTLRIPALGTLRRGCTLLKAVYLGHVVLLFIVPLQVGIL